MMTTGKILLAVSFLMALAALAALPAWPAPAKPVSSHCTMIGMGNVILIRANLETFKGMPRTFGTVFQGKAGFGAGRRLTVAAGGVDVGTMKTKPILGGDIGGELQLNAAPRFGDRTKPFPPDFPRVGPNTSIAV